METELENILKNTYKDDMMEYINSHAEAFEELICLAVGDKQPYSWRAAWILSDNTKKNDQRVKPYIDEIINKISDKKSGHKRELMKVLMKMELNDNQTDKLFNESMDIWEAINLSPSVRFYAFRIISNIAMNNPELINEIKFLVEDHFLETLSPGIKRSVDKMIDKVINN